MPRSGGSGVSGSAEIKTTALQPRSTITAAVHTAISAAVHTAISATPSSSRTRGPIARLICVGLSLHP